MAKDRNSLDEYNRFVGYLVLTFTSVFIYFPLIWLLNIFGTRAGLYTRWAAISAFIVLFNLGFYHARLPAKPMTNLTLVALIDIAFLIVEYLLFFYS